MLGVDRRLDRVEEPQVLRVVSEGQLLARQEVQVLNRPATPRGDAVGLPERPLEVLACHEPVHEGRLGLRALLELAVATPQRVHRRLDGVGTHRLDFLAV